MKTYSELKGKVEAIFTSIGIQFERIDFKNDQDLNYIINISTYGKLKPLNAVKAILYLSECDYTMNLLVTNICRISKTDDVSPYLKIVNETNIKLISGNFAIFDTKDCKQIVFRDSINCGEFFNDLDSQLLQWQINMAFNGLEFLLELLKKMRQEINK